MSGEWIKVEKDTPEKPEVLAIADRLGITSEEAFGRCFKVWRWADSQSVDGIVKNVTPKRIDDIAGLAGFASALLEVGWLHDRSGAVQIPNFERHLGQAAKQRAVASVRAKRSRVRCSNAPSAADPMYLSSNSSPEKREDPFERFWGVFPPGRKSGKGAARKAWVQACRKADVEVIIAAAAEYAQSPLGKSQYVCMPSTWLNQERWTDDRAAWLRSDGKGPPPKKPPETDAQRAERVRLQRQLGPAFYTGGIGEMPKD